jgi:acyl-CoA reductase-like NAD-dependent aldehyde dehydrogenase
MQLMREESFGPVIGIQKVTSDAEAIELMNDTEYGLTAGVYTPKERRAKAILANVRSGSAYWNCCDRVSPRLPGPASATPASADAVHVRHPGFHSPEGVAPALA